MLIELGRSIAATSPGGFWTFVGILALCAPLTFWLAFSRLRESRLIQDTPTSRVRSAAQGYVEFEGFARLMPGRSEEHTSELQSLMRISYAVFCLKKKKKDAYERNTRQANNKQIQKNN